MIPFLLKSVVKQHTRRTKTGKVAIVRQHTDSRTKKAEPKPKPLTVGDEVAFKPEGGKKTRRGTVAGLTKHKAKVKGLRDASGKEEVFTVDRTSVKPWSEHAAAKEKDERYASGDKSNATRVVAVKESLRRKVQGTRRLGLTEDQVLQSPYVHGFILKASRDLAVKNGITPAVDGNASSDLWHRAADPEYADLIHEYALGALQSLRREADKAPVADIKEFREHLKGERRFSRIFTTMMKHGETAAIRHLNETRARKDGLFDHTGDDRSDDLRTEAENARAKERMAKLQTAPEQEKTLTESVEGGIDRILNKLPGQDADIIRRKFGLGDHDPHTNEQLAEALNAAGSKFEGEHKWTRNNVGAAFAAALEKLKGTGGIEELREFLKSMKDRLEELKKSQHQPTICVDFDGVIADYSQGFQGRDIFGPPLPGAVDGMKALKAAGWKVIVFTSRPATPALADYLRLHEIPHDGINRPSGPEAEDFSGKPVADFYLDDRAVRFINWEQARGAILDDQPHTGDAQAACDEFHRKLKAAIGNPLVDLASGVTAGLGKSLHLYSLDPPKKDLTADFPGAEILETRHGLTVVASDELRKSFSSDLAEKYPDGRWITIKEGPLAGRHVFIVPHKNGTASVLAGGGPALKHKVLGLKKDEKKEESSEPKKEEKPEKKEVSEEKRAEVEAAKKEVKTGIAEERRKMAEIVRTHLGKEIEITAQEKADIEKKVAGIADPGKKASERMKETVRLKREKDEVLKQVAAEAKKAILEEEPTGQGAATIHAVVKEHAEDLLNHYYRIQSLERQGRDLNKMLKTGSDKRPAADIVAFAPLSRKDLEGIVADEKMRQAELDAHYKLIATTRGTVDARGKEKKAEGGSRMEGNIRTGGFEALTGILGEATGNAVIPREVYDEIGPQNAAVLAHYYLKNGGHDVKSVSKKTAKYIESAGGPVAQLAIERGDRFLGMARKVAEFGRGEQNLMSAAQAMGTALKYHSKAFEAYGQAEGALNQGAELVYEFGNDKGKLEFAAGSRESLERRRRKLKLNKGDVSIVKDGDGYKMSVPSRSFEKLIHEAPAAPAKSGEGLTPAEIKQGKANTDDFRPAMLREYTPEDSNGESRRIDLKPEQQAAARLIEKQKRVYLNFEAGTGKSLAIIAAKAHLEDATGKPKKTIIAMPQKLMANFKDEVEKFSHYKVAIVDDATSAKREAKYNADPDTIVVVNKEKFNFDKALIKKAGFDMVAADEAHKITQREGRGGSEMSKGLSEVAKGAEYYVAMSGTPTPSDLSELYFHANAMAPEKFSSQKEFMAKFGAAHKGVGFKEKIQEFMNRELGDHVFTAKKRLDTTFTLKRHSAELHPEQAEAYRRASEMFRSRQISPLQRDQQLNTVLNSFDHRKNGKFKEIRKIVDDHLAKKAEDEKLIFYAKNYDTVNQIQDFLRQNYAHVGEAVSFTGREKVKDIRANKERFKHDERVRFAIHTRAGVEGLNLQYDGNGGGATTAVAVASGEDSYAPLDQFFSRANRTGAKKDIHAHLVLTDTPHDMGTELRLDEKKGVGELIKEDVRKALAEAPGLFLLRKAKYTSEQQEKIRKVMEEFKAGTLRSSDGSKVTDHKQAIAIALSQAGVGK